MGEVIYMSDYVDLPSSEIDEFADEILDELNPDLASKLIREHMWTKSDDEFDRQLEAMERENDLLEFGGYDD